MSKSENLCLVKLNGGVFGVFSSRAEADFWIKVEMDDLPGNWSRNDFESTSIVLNAPVEYTTAQCGLLKDLATQSK